MALKDLHDKFVFKFLISVLKPIVTVIPDFEHGSKDIEPGYNLVTLCGSKDYELLRQSLISIKSSFRKLPHLYVFTDFWVSDELSLKIRKLYPPDKLHIISADECINYHKSEGQNLLADFATKNPWNLKFAVILQAADLGLPLLFSDTDTLWFDDPMADITSFLKSDSNIQMSFDFYPGYDFNLIKEANLNLSVERPYYNSGIMFIKKFAPHQLSIINNLLPVAIHIQDTIKNNDNNLTEQTLFANLQKEEGPSLIIPEKYLLFPDDRFDMIPSRKKGAIARHYIGQIRQVFWRDAFFYRWLKSNPNTITGC